MVSFDEKKAGDHFIISLPESLKISMVYCPPGTFIMGVPPKRGEKWKPDIAHEVTLTKGFWIGKYPVTQQQFLPVIGINPSENKGMDFPVTNVNIIIGKWYAKKLNDLLATNVFRLPSEAEWEYACRAGSTGEFAGTGQLNDMGWFNKNSGGVIHPIAEKMPNDWGIHDMHGNVWEWCDDTYANYTSDAVVDPQNQVMNTNYIMRGGAYHFEAERCTSAYRQNASHQFGWEGNWYGFRLAANDDSIFFKKGA